MHISDGVLPLFWVVLWYLLSGAFVAVGLYKVRRRSEASQLYLPMLGVLAAAVTVISIWHIPVPVTGSSSHPIGTPMAAILVGPFASILITVPGLVIHLFLAHGGLTTLGANTFSMGVVGSLVGYATYRLTRKYGLSYFMAAGLAGLVGDIAVYTTTAFQLAIALFPGSLWYHWGIFFLGFGPTQIPIAVMEFFFTGAVIDHIMKARPDIIQALGRSADAA